MFHAKDAFIFLYNTLKNAISHSDALKTCIQYNPILANYLLDMQIEKKKTKKKNQCFIYNETRLEIIFNDLLLAINNYDEDMVVKMIQLYDLILNERRYPTFVEELINTISPLMIYSLFDKLSKVLTSDELLLISQIFDEKGYTSIAKYIKGTVKTNKSVLYNILDRVKLTKLIR